MNKISVVLFFLFSSFFGVTQSEDNANHYFDRYEYAKAYKAYKEAGIDQMNADDVLKYIYSCYVIGDFKEVCNNIYKIDEIEGLDPFFLWASAQSHMAVGQKEQAKENYLKYKMKVETNHEFIDLRLQSLEEIEFWDTKNYMTNSILHSNSTKSDISGYKSAYGFISYREIGLDSSKNLLSPEQYEDAELLLLKPMIMFDGSSSHELVLLPDSLSLASVNSISFVPNSDQVFFSYSEPAHDNEIYCAPHLYEGIYDVNSNSISNIQKWKYSGFEDTSSIAHVSINSLGTKMVFTKKKYYSDYSDIFISERLGNIWSEPRPLEAINSEWNEVFPLFQEDGSLCFSSNGRKGFGKLDIYNYSFYKESIEHFQAPINGPMDDFNYFEDSLLMGAHYTSNRFNGTGDDDIYRIIYDTTVSEVLEVKNTKAIMETEVFRQDQILHFNFDEVVSIEAPVVDSNLVHQLSRDNGFIIRLECHADERGTDSYNQELSEKRGETVKKRLISQGIPENKIVINALGESDPLIRCEICKEEQHAENRVVIFSVQKRKQKDAL